MHRRPLHAVFVALVLASASIAAIPQAVAQPSTRAYAPEALWTLTPAEQTRVRAEDRLRMVKMAAEQPVRETLLVPVPAEPGTEVKP